MKISEATFITSCTSIDSCPKATIPEYAFVGRSNVGKSSLINMLVSKKKLAKTSGTPGKTQTFNYFLINESWHIVDLPGYGFAKISKTQREKWDKNMREYLQRRENLFCVFVLVDGTIPPQNKDLEFIRWLGINQIPFSIVFTKMDRISKNHVQSTIANYKKTLLKDWEFLPQFFITSSVNNTGKDELLNFIEEINRNTEK